MIEAVQKLEEEELLQTKTVLLRDWKDGGAC